MLCVMTMTLRPPGQAGDRHVGAPGETELGDHLLHAAGAFLRGHVGWEAELGCVLEGSADRQLGMQDVVLGDVADAPAQFVVEAIEVPPVVEDVALGGRLVPGEGLGRSPTGGSVRRLSSRRCSVPSEAMMPVGLDGGVVHRVCMLNYPPGRILRLLQLGVTQQ
jgi:hypothetical protein